MTRILRFIESAGFVSPLHCDGAQRPQAFRHGTAAIL
jgi:hypothetical protein